MASLILGIVNFFMGPLAWVKRESLARHRPAPQSQIVTRKGWPDAPESVTGSDWKEGPGQIGIPGRMSPECVGTTAEDAFIKTPDALGGRKGRLLMSLNTFGHLFRVTTWGESHGPAIGCAVDGCPPGLRLSEADLQPWLDKRKPGQNKFTTQRQEADQVRILSGVFEGLTTGTSIQLMIENTDQRSKDYGEIAQAFRPGHADITYHQKYGVRDYRGGGRCGACHAGGAVTGADHHRVYGADGAARD